MFGTKKFISRRTILRGIGTGIALPFLDAMVPAFTATARTAANPLKRFGAIFVPLGERPGYWTPTKVGADFEFTPILKSLEPYRNWITLVSELCNPLDGHAVAQRPPEQVQLGAAEALAGFRRGADRAVVLDEEKTFISAWLDLSHVALFGSHAS